MKRFYKAFIALLLLLCLIPSLGLLVTGPSEAGANEILAEAPRLKNRDGSLNTGFLADAVAWTRDRFAFRQELITLWSELSVGVFRTSPVKNVTVGTDGWYYYTLTMDDYTGTALSETELWAAARNLFLMQEYAENSGMDFVFTAAPNKNTLYPEHMPLSVAGGHENANLSLLEESFDTLGIQTADLVGAFAEEPVLYYATDSHWNAQGAALGADTILQALGRDSDYYGGSFVAGEEHTGDLYEMLYPAGRLTENNRVPEKDFTYTTERDPNGGEAITIHSFREGAEGSLYCWRDSFGVALYPYLAESFGEAVFSRAADYDLTKAKAAGADTVVIELVERNLRNLAEKQLTFPAPVRSEPETAEMCETGELCVTEGKTADGQTLTHVTGKILSGFSGKSAIYILSENVYYECCICFDAEGNAGFSAWLPGESIDAVQTVRF